MNLKDLTSIVFTAGSLLLIGILLLHHPSFAQSNLTSSLTNRTASLNFTAAPISSKHFTSFSTLTITPVIVEVGKTFSISGKLIEYQSEIGLGGKRVFLRSVPTLGESFIPVTATTNSSGYFKLSTRTPNNPGIYLIGVHFDGSGLYYESNSVPEVLSVVPSVLFAPIR